MLCVRKERSLRLCLFLVLVAAVDETIFTTNHLPAVLVVSSIGIVATNGVVVFVGAVTCPFSAIERGVQTGVKLVKFSPLQTPSVKSWTLGLGTNESNKRSFWFRPLVGVLSSFVLPTVSAGRYWWLYIHSIVLGDGFTFRPFWTAFLRFIFSW